MVTSRYIQLNDWLLLEYSYTANAPDSLNYRTTPGGPGEDYIGIYKISNSNTGEYQFVNMGNPVLGHHLTGNCLDWSASPVDQNQQKWALTNVSGSGNNPFTPPSNLLLEDYSDKMTRVYYDTIKLHVLSGYNFEGLDGFVLEVYFQENSKNKFKAATFCFSKDLTTQTFTFNTAPVMLSEKMYDKYLEFNVPSLYVVQEEYWADPSYVEGFAFNYTHPSVPQNPNPGGYLKDSPIFFKLIELTNVETLNDIDYFDLKDSVVASIMPSDTYSSLGCTIKESDDGDYFEFYPTWQNGFIDTYISNLNSTGLNDWAVINEIQVIEQVGTEFKQTAQIVQFQYDSYDTPNYFRPIVKYADTAFAFSIRYIMKFFNRATSEQIIRIANITSYEPNKYGKGLTKIAIEENIKPMKVYNKVINIKRLQNNTQVGRQMPITTKYIDVYVDRYNVAVNADNNDVKDDGTIFYGQGELTMFLSKFDNVIKFKLVKLSQNEYLPINLSQSTVYVNFILDNEQTLSFETIKTNAETGEFTVTIKREFAQRILRQSKDTSFYIVAKTDDSVLESVIYTGSYKSSSAISNNIFEIKKPLLDYMRDKTSNLSALSTSLTNESEKLNNDKSKLSKQSRELQRQLNMIKSILPSLPIATQLQLQNNLPESIIVIDEPKLESGTTTYIKENPSSSSSIQPIIKNTGTSGTLNPPGGDNTTNN